MIAFEMWIHYEIGILKLDPPWCICLLTAINEKSCAKLRKTKELLTESPSSHHLTEFMPVWVLETTGKPPLPVASWDCAWPFLRLQNKAKAKRHPLCKVHWLDEALKCWDTASHDLITFFSHSENRHHSKDCSLGLNPPPGLQNTPFIQSIPQVKCNLLKSLSFAHCS